MASIHYKKGKSGKRTYYVVVPLRRSRKWIKAGSLKNAKILKREIESYEEAKQLDKLGFTDRDKGIDEFFKEYAEYIDVRSAPRTVQRYLSVLNTFKHFLRLYHPKIKTLSQITRDTIESHQNRRLKSIDLKIAADGTKPGNHKNKRLPQPQTVNNEVTMLAIAFNWAHKRDLIQNVPTRSIKKLRPGYKREPRILTPKECSKFLKAAAEIGKRDRRLKIYSSVFRFLLNTGLRSGELCNLTWDDIDLKNGLIKIKPKPGWTPKGAAREFYLNDTSLALLKTIDPDSNYVFLSDSGQPLSTDDIRRVLIKTAKIAGLKNFTRVHDLRHTFSSQMQMNGVAAATVSAILGHRDLSTTQIYTHQTRDHLRKSINQINIG